MQINFNTIQTHHTEDMRQTMKDGRWKKLYKCTLCPLNKSLLKYRVHSNNSHFTFFMWAYARCVWVNNFEIVWL